MWPNKDIDIRIYFGTGDKWHMSLGNNFLDRSYDFLGLYDNHDSMM